MSDSKRPTKSKKRSQIKMIWGRFKKNRLAMFGFIMFGVLLVLGMSAPLIIPYTSATEQVMAERLLKPQLISREWPGFDVFDNPVTVVSERFLIFGTDRFGRDMFARILHGAFISLSIGFISIMLSMSVGAVIGSTAGYYGGAIDNVLMRIMDVFLAIPQTLLAISIVAALGNSLFNLVIAMSIAAIPRFARIIRSSILTVSSMEFVEAARACATSDRRIIARHIIPNAIGPIIVQATLNLAATIIAISGLSFIGLGVAPPRPEWGAMINEGRVHMRQFPHLVVVPGIAIVIAVMSLNLMGDGLRDALDPRLKN
ncbi:MAG: ABC transporter permease [Treponema sp.]|nr:ABC transporter permease [Treponema sp.]